MTSIDPAVTTRGETWADSWRRLPLGLRIAIVGFAILVLLSVLIRFIGNATSGSTPGGPSSSSFADAPAGFAAYAELLTRSGHAVIQEQNAITSTTLHIPGTLVIAEPQGWTAANTDRVLSYAAHGGNVLVAGRPPAGLLETLLGPGAPIWIGAPTSGTGTVITALAGALPDVSEVDLGTDATGSWSTSNATPLVRDAAGDIVLAVAQAGQSPSPAANGTVFLLADTAPLTNNLLDRADNAALALDIAGAGPSSPTTDAVTFDEYDHGYGQHAGGLAAIPTEFKIGLLVLLLAVVVWMIGAARRFGPPELAERPLIPARVRYVDAVGRVLSAAPPDQLSDALAPVRSRTRALVTARLGVPADANDAAIVHAAASTPLPDGVLDAVLSSPSDSDGVMATGRALAAVEREGAHR